MEGDHAHAAAHVTPHAGHIRPVGRRRGESNGGGARIEGTGVGADDALTEVGDLQAFVAEVAFDELGHGPVEEDGMRFGVIAETIFDLLSRGWLPDPGVARPGVGAGAAIRGCGPQCVAQTADDVAHGVESGDVGGGEGSDFGFAASVVVPKLDAGLIEEGNEEAVDGGGPSITAAGQIELLDDQRMEEAGKVGAGGHAHTRERLLDGAGSADAGTAFDDKDTLAGAREIGGACQSVVAGANDDDIPGAGGQFADGRARPISPRTVAVGDVIPVLTYIFRLDRGRGVEGRKRGIPKGAEAVLPAAQGSIGRLV